MLCCITVLRHNWCDLKCFPTWQFCIDLAICCSLLVNVIAFFVCIPLFHEELWNWTCQCYRWCLFWRAALIVCVDFSLCLASEKCTYHAAYCCHSRYIPSPFWLVWKWYWLCLHMCLLPVVKTFIVIQGQSIPLKNCRKHIKDWKVKPCCIKRTCLCGKFSVLEIITLSVLLSDNDNDFNQDRATCSEGSF